MVHSQQGSGKNITEKVSLGHYEQFLSEVGKKNSVLPQKDRDPGYRIQIIYWNICNPPW